MEMERKFSHLRIMFSVGDHPFSACATVCRHALTQPTPNPYEGSFNSNLPFRDCNESCIFLSRTNVYHSITNRETFVPVSRPTFLLPSLRGLARIVRRFLRPRYILAMRESTNCNQLRFTVIELDEIFGHYFLFYFYFLSYKFHIKST